MVVPIPCEEMTCIMCGKSETGNPGEVSEWRAFKWDEGFFYACPEEFPPDGSADDEIEEAHQRVIKKILETVFGCRLVLIEEEDEEEPWFYPWPRDGTKACRVCGCTNDRSCPGGCYWVEPDLCSRCVGELERM